MVEKKCKGIFYILMLIGSFALLTEANQMDYGANVSPLMAFFGLISLVYWSVKCLITVMEILLGDTKNNYDDYTISRRGNYHGRKYTYSKTARCHSDSSIIDANGQYNPIPQDHTKYMPKQPIQEDTLVKDLSEKIRIQDNIQVVIIDEKDKK